MSNRSMRLDVRLPHGALDPDGKRVLSASVGQLFMAGVIPGLMLATMLGMTTFYRAWKNG